ncbi:Rdx family-domain-containing protein [Lipomyces tetrasporus]
MPVTIRYPHVSIEFCTACKWNLRAAWYAQELLSTFSTELGEVSMIPGSGGTFIVRLTPNADADEIVIWNRKDKNGFPDSKDLKRLVRDILFPARDLGHVDRHAKEGTSAKPPQSATLSYADTSSAEQQLPTATTAMRDEKSTEKILDDDGDVCLDCSTP